MKSLVFIAPLVLLSTLSASQYYSKFNEFSRNGSRVIYSAGKTVDFVVSDNTFTFSDVRFKADTNKGLELNLGLSRRYYNKDDALFGGYLFLDAMKMPGLNGPGQYSQITAGVERLALQHNIRANLYLPVVARQADRRMWILPAGDVLKKIVLRDEARGGVDMSLDAKRGSLNWTFGSFYYPETESGSEVLAGVTLGVTMKDGVFNHVDMNANVKVSTNGEKTYTLGTHYKFSDKRAVPLSSLNNTPIKRDIDIVTTPVLEVSYSQLGQDKDVLEYFQYKRNGYFLNVGAHEGIELDNTYLLEKDYGWRGICFEPSPKTFPKLINNRPLCNNQQALLYDQAGKKVYFYEADVLAGVSDDIGIHKDTVLLSKKIELVTTTLNLVLDRENAPKNIDFMSLDTEGSELNVLKGLNLDKYKIEFIDLEHNFEEPKRTEIRNYLERRGYVYFRQNEFDDYYIRRSMISRRRMAKQWLRAKH